MLCSILALKIQEPHPLSNNSSSERWECVPPRESVGATVVGEEWGWVGECVCGGSSPGWLPSRVLLTLNKAVMSVQSSSPRLTAASAGSRDTVTVHSESGTMGSHSSHMGRLSQRGGFFKQMLRSFKWSVPMAAFSGADIIELTRI